MDLSLLSWKVGGCDRLGPVDAEPVDVALLQWVPVPPSDEHRILSAWATGCTDPRLEVTIRFSRSVEPKWLSRSANCRVARVGHPGDESTACVCRLLSLW
jgi:hypothetical protein